MDTVVSKTPLRISFCGGGTDYPEFYEHHGGGEVIGASINKYITIIVEHHSGESIILNDVHYNDVAEIENKIVQGCLRHYELGPGLSIRILSDVSENGCGLGTSSALTIGLMKVLHGGYYRSDRVVEDSYQIERDAGLRCGKQDHCLSAMGGVRHLYFGKEILCVPFEVDLMYLRDYLMLFHAGERRQSKPKMEISIDVVCLKAIRSLVPHFAEALLSKDIERFGNLLGESWVLKRSLSDQVTTPELNRIYQRAIDAGAYGGKLLGAGQGGYFLICAFPEKMSQITDAVSVEATPFPFSFENRGSVVL